MDLGIRGQAALVTAGSRGLGRAVALELAREGARVALAGRDLGNAEQSAEEIASETGSEVVGWRCDVSRGEEVRELVDRAAGGAFDALDDDAWQKAFETNLLSVVRLVRATLPHMKDGGRILTIASSSVKQPIPGLILSNTMRAGVAGLMKTLSEELGPRGILVNTLCPGRIATDRLRELDRLKAEREGKPEEVIQRESLRGIPLGRYGEPAEFARTAVFLLSRANTYITGTSLMVDGGMVKAL